jgi:O-acetylhomoserine (thiol)-lyase
MKSYHINTKCLQSGYSPKNGEARVMPIVQSTTFRYDSAETLGRLFDLEEAGHFYTRLSNPTAEAVEKKIADLEGGIGAKLCASGQSAVLAAIMNIAKSGDHVVCASAIYGGTFNLFNKTLRDMGIEFTFVSAEASEEELRAAFRPNTKLVFAESLSNPSLVVLDIEKFARAAHAHQVPFIVDNTFPTPIHCRPIEFGADIVIHSTSKYLDGHACALGGVIVDSGKFDWAASGKFPGLSAPEPSYHGITYTERFGAAAYIVKITTHMLRDLGVAPSPMNAFLLNLGLETLHLRMERHTSNAMALALALEKHAKIIEVNYPGLASSKYRPLVEKYMPAGTCGVVSFRVKGGRETAMRFMNALQLASIEIHVCDSKTCVLHPASTTHRQLTDQQLQEADIAPDQIRMSVGLEHADDIIADVLQALEASL